MKRQEPTSSCAPSRTSRTRCQQYSPSWSWPSINGPANNQPPIPSPGEFGPAIGLKTMPPGQERSWRPSFEIRHELPTKTSLRQTKPCSPRLHPFSRAPPQLSQGSTDRPPTPIAARHRSSQRPHRPCPGKRSEKCPGVAEGGG